MTAGPSRTPTSTRASQVLPATLCLLMAVLLNMAALEAVGSVLARWRSQGARTASGAPRVMTVVAQALPATTPDPPSHAREARTAPPLRAPPARPPSSTAAARPASPTHPPEPLDPSANDALATRFYRIDEVNMPAAPAADSDPDWNLDAAALDASGLSRLVFEVFISGTGDVVSCTILEPKTIDARTAQMLEGRLRQTRLQPAQRGGQAVASVRRIEFTVQPSQ